MKKPFLTIAALALGAFLSHFAAAQDPKGVVEKAIAAHGGAEKISRLNRVHSKAEGTIDILPGQPATPFVGESWRMDGNSKMTLTLSVQGVKVSVTDAVHGDKQWRQAFGETLDLSKAEVAEVHESRYVDQIAKLGFLKDAAIQLSALPETKVGDKPAVGVLVKSQGHKDVKLYFDKETSLLTKVEHTAHDLMSGKDVTEELVQGDFQDKDGLKYAMKTTLWRDGKKIMEGKVTQLEFVDKIDEKVFARP